MTPTKDDIALVHQSVKKAKSSFYWGMRLLPQKRREAMFALYALARHLDDIADGDQEQESKKAELAFWHEEVERLYEGEQKESLSRALLPAVIGYSLEKEELHELIRGMEMDATGPLIAPDQDTLMLYCRRVAGTIGLLSVSIFGRTEPISKEFAIALANALQLTNILRDINEDAETGRLYVPQNLLTKHQVPLSSPKETIAHQNFTLVFHDLAEMASHWFSKVDRLLETTPTSGLRPAIIMMVVYRRLFEKIRQTGWQLGTPKLKLSKGAQIWALLSQYLVYR